MTIYGLSFFVVSIGAMAFFRWLLLRGETDVTWRSLREKYGVSKQEISGRSRWVVGSHTVRPGKFVAGQPSFNCFATCDEGIVFGQKILFWAKPHFVIPWNDLVCSRNGRWDKQFDGQLILHFEDPPQDRAIQINEQMEQALVGRGLLTSAPPAEPREHQPTSLTGRVLLGLSPVLFASSLLFSCFHFEGETQDWHPNSDQASGLLLLCLGWLGIIGGEVAWLANPLWLAAMAGLVGFKSSDYESDDRSPGVALVHLVFSLVALLVALTFTLQTTTQYYHSGQPSAKIGGLGPGYLLWIASMVTLSLSAICFMIWPKKKRPEKSE